MSSALRHAARVALSPLIAAYDAVRIRKALKILARTRELPREPGPIRVVFFAQYLPTWNKIDSVYQAMLESDKFEPHIVCIPPDDKIASSSEEEGTLNPTYEHFISHGYDALDATLDDGGWLDIRSLNPDYVFHDRPYNAFIPKEYSSSEVATYARICSIMYGSSWTDNYAAVAFNTDYFKDVSIYFAEDQTNALVFDKKFRLGVKRGLQEAIFVGSPALEDIITRTPRSEGAWAELSGSPRVLWTPRWTTDPQIGGSHFLDYKDWLIDYAQEHPTWSFVLRPHPLMFDNFTRTGEMSASEVEDYRRTCDELENVLIDEDPEYIDTMSRADTLIMDSSSIVLEAFFLDKPIIYCPHPAAGVVPEYRSMADTLYEAESVEQLESLVDALLNEDEDLKSKRQQTVQNLSKLLAVGSTNRILNALADRCDA